MSSPRTTLEQWRTLQSVIDCGGFAQAAEHLHRSQSAVSYSIAKLQEQLGIDVLTLRGRKAALTKAGQTLLARARELLREAAELEQLASQINAGWETEITLAFEAVFPAPVLLDTMARFSQRQLPTRVQLREVVLSGAEEAILDHSADLVISPIIPPGYVGEKLTEIEFVAVAHPDHPLHKKNTLDYHDLKTHTQLVVRDSGMRQSRDVGWLGAKHRWTVSHISTSISAITRKLGFGWLPKHMIETELAQSQLRPLPLKRGQQRQAILYLVLPRGDNTGPATQLLAEMLCQAIRNTNPV